MRVGVSTPVAALVFCLAIAAVRLPAQSFVTAQASPQQQTTQPVFRTGIDVVPLTVTVTDRRGQPVTDLTQNDFRVFENGSRREVVGFHPQTLLPGEATTPAIQIGRRADQAGLVTRRTFLIVLPLGRIQEPTKALDGAIAFVKDRLLPQDAVAVLAFHRVTTFTTNHDAIATILTRYRAEHERLFADVRQFFVMSRTPYRLRAPLPIEVDLGLPRAGGMELPASIKADIDKSLFDGVLPSSELRFSSERLLGMDLATRTGDRSYKRQYGFAELLKALQGLGLTLSDAVLQSAPLKLFAGIEHLRFMEGERHLLYLGGSPIARSADLARLFAARANDARVIVNYVSTTGTRIRGASGCSPCRDLAELTGGLYTSLDMMDAALAKVDRRSRSFYLLGYVPSSTTLDRQYRHVRVDVARRDVTVAFRHGYFASEEIPALEEKAFVARTRSNTLKAFDENVSDVDLHVEAAIEPSAGAEGPSQVRLDITVNVSSVSITRAAGLHTGRLELTVYAADQRERVIGEIKLSWDLRADEATFAAWTRTGVKRTVRVPVVGDPRAAKVIAYDAASDRAGSMSVALRR
jgi:VWFA-related protein